MCLLYTKKELKDVCPSGFEGKIARSKKMHTGLQGLKGWVSPEPRWAPQG